MAEINCSQFAAWIMSSEQTIFFSPYKWILGDYFLGFCYTTCPRYHQPNWIW